MNKKENNFKEDRVLVTLENIDTLPFEDETEREEFRKSIERYNATVATPEQLSVLKTIATRYLSMELEQREGVYVKYAAPYEDVTVSVNGPAHILTVID